MRVEMTPAAPTTLSYPQKILISVSLSIFLVILGMTITNNALRTLQKAFPTGRYDAQWLMSGYLLALGMSVPLSAWRRGRFPMKRTYVIGLGVFMVGSFLCGIAPSLGVLVAARIGQGIGGGIALPLGTALLFSAFPAEERGWALTTFGIALVAAAVLGPLLDGYLVAQGLWHWIFLINLPIGLLSISFALW